MRRGQVELDQRSVVVRDLVVVAGLWEDRKYSRTYNPQSLDPHPPVGCRAVGRLERGRTIL